MPTYLYRCECGSTDVTVCAVADRPSLMDCPACGRDMERDFFGEHAGQAQGDFWRGHASETLAVDPSQVKEYAAYDKQIGAPSEGYNKAGCPMFKSASQKKQYAKAHGYHFKNSYY